jgi:prevent-host-death family protein
MVMWEIDNSKEARIMYQVDIIEAKEKLLELIEAAMRGEKVAITQHNQPVVKLVGIPPANKKR